MKPDVPSAKVKRHDSSAATARSDVIDSGASPVRQLFESALREGPLFRPEGVVADKVSETNGETAAEEYLAKAKGKEAPHPPEKLGKSGGWIFIADRHGPESQLRIAVSERLTHENAADFTLEDLANHLSIASDEILRYAAFSDDAYRALATARDQLKVFETENRRYQCPSAVAATAIESLRRSISSRKTNFENVTGDTTAALMSDAMLARTAKPASSPEDERRVERHAAIANLMQETERSLADASDLLDGMPRKKGYGHYRRQLPGIVSRRFRRGNGRRPNVPTLKPEPKLASRTVLTAPVVQTMEQAIMRREASEFLRLRREELKKISVLAFTTVTAAVAIGLWRFDGVSQPEIIIGAIGCGVIATILAREFIQHRYAKPTFVWKEILERPVQAPR